MNDLIIRLPKIKPKAVLTTLSEVYDWGHVSLNIPKIHQKTQGEGVKIGIVDSGQSTHFETQHALGKSNNFSQSPTVIDKQGHGSFVAGIIGSAKNNEGIIGVAPLSKIYYAKAMDDGGSGNPSYMVKSINWLIEQKVDIISISAGMFVDFKPLHKAVQQAFNKNITIIAAVGNSSNRYYDVAFPARYPEVIGVAAYDRKHKIAPFSSIGVNISFAMPGVDIYSTYLENQYAKMSGTSFATPILTGICALILSYHKKGNHKTACKTPKQLLEHLIKYSVPLGDKKSAGFGTLNTKEMFSL